MNHSIIRAVFGLLLAIGASTAPAQVAAPFLTPGAGAEAPVTVSMTTETAGATIHYTLDGSKPTAASSVYTGPVTLTEPGFIRAVAIAGAESSRVTSARYNGVFRDQPEVALERTITGGGSPSPSVALALTTGAPLRSVVVEERLGPLVEPSNIGQGGVWSPDRRVIRWGPFANASAMTLTYQLSLPTGLGGATRASASASVDGEWTFQSGASTVSFGASVDFRSTPDRTEAPTVEPAGSAELPATVNAATEVEGAVIRYTLDGSAPTASSPVLPGDFPITSEAWLRVSAFVDGLLASPPQTYWFYERPNEAAVRVSATVDADSDPASPKVAFALAPDALVESTTFEVLLPPGLTPSAISDGGAFLQASNRIVWGPFSGNAAINPEFRVAGLGGTYPLASRLTVNGHDRGLRPGPSVFMSGDTGGIQTELPERVEQPALTISSTSELPATLELDELPAGSEVRYTLDGTIPTAASPKLEGVLNIATDTTVILRAFAPGLRPSQLIIADFRQAESLAKNLEIVRTVSSDESAAPAVSLAATASGDPGSWTVAEKLSPGLEPSQINEGGSFNPATGVIHWGAFSGDGTRTLSYRVTGRSGGHSPRGAGAFDGYTAAVTGDQRFSIRADAAEKTAAPMISPEISTGQFPVTVTISTDDPSARIHYTVDGSTPTEESPRYEGPFEVATVGQVRARAFGEFQRPSDAVRMVFGPETLPPDTILDREILRNGTADPEVRISVQPGPLVGAYVVVERVPDGLTPSAVTHQGVFDSDAGVIRWGPFLGGDERSLRYIPQGANGNYALSGFGSFNGFSRPTDGETDIVIGDYAVLTASAENNATDRPLLSLELAPDSATQCYTVEALLPDSVAPESFSHGGVYSERFGAIRWGPYLDGEIRDFRFEATGQAQALDVRYVISIDGTSLVMRAPDGLSIGPAIPDGLIAFAGDERVLLRWDPVDIGDYRAYFHPEDDPEAEQVVALGDPIAGFARIDGLTNDVTYHFTLVNAAPDGDESARSQSVSATPQAGLGFAASLRFDQPAYPSLASAPMLTLEDFDANQSNAAVDTATVRVTSDQDATGLIVNLTETGVNTGVFTLLAGDGFTLDELASNAAARQLQVREGYRIHALYTDDSPADRAVANARVGIFDRDNDGLGDWWERLRYGTLNATDGSGDLDGDRFSGRQEYAAGTDPHDSHDRLRVILRANASGGVTIEWNSHPGRAYVIEKSFDLDAFFPMTAEMPAPSTPQDMSVVDAVGEEGAFYRVIAHPPAVPN